MPTKKEVNQSKKLIVHVSYHIYNLSYTPTFYIEYYLIFCYSLVANNFAIYDEQQAKGQHLIGLSLKFATDQNYYTSCLDYYKSEKICTECIHSQKILNFLPLHLN